MRRLYSFIAVATFALGPVACAATTDSSDPSVDPSVANASGEDEEIKAAKPITEADQGKTVEVALGQSFSIQLGSNPTTGYKWSVTSVDRTLGYPKESFKAGGGAVGSGGTQRFTWATSGPLNLEGKHKITLEYQRPWAETSPPANTFTVTVDVRSSAKCGDGPACGANQHCVMCRGQKETKLLCIPKGAMC